MNAGAKSRVRSTKIVVDMRFTSMSEGEAIGIVLDEMNNERNLGFNEARVMLKDGSVAEL